MLLPVVLLLSGAGLGDTSVLLAAGWGLGDTSVAFPVALPFGAGLGDASGAGLGDASGAGLGDASGAGLGDASVALPVVLLSAVAGLGDGDSGVVELSGCGLGDVMLTAGLGLGGSGEGEAAGDKDGDGEGEGAGDGEGGVGDGDGEIVAGDGDGDGDDDGDTGIGEGDGAGDGEGDVQLLSQGSDCTALFVASQVPPDSAGDVTMKVRLLIPGPHAVLHALQADQLPTQSLGGVVKENDPALMKTMES